VIPDRKLVEFNPWVLFRVRKRKKCVTNLTSASADFRGQYRLKPVFVVRYAVFQQVSTVLFRILVLWATDNKLGA
jgi:hypothetical protein